MSKTYLDYTGQLTADELKAAGVSGVCRYLSWLPNPKVILRTEYDSLITGEIDVILNWEYDAYDWSYGGEYGRSHGLEAVRQAKEIGYPLGKPIPGSCDFNISRIMWNTSGKAYGIAYSAAIADGGYVPGVYGPWNALQWCLEEIPAFKWFWQAGMSWAWENNNQDWPHANLIQRRHMTVNGLDTDLNEVVEDWTMPTPYPFDYGDFPDPTQEYATHRDRFKHLALLLMDIATNEATGHSGWDTSQSYRSLLLDRVDGNAQKILTILNGFSITLSTQDKADIVAEVKATLANEVAEAVYERIKAQFDKS